MTKNLIFLVCLATLFYSPVLVSFAESRAKKPFTQTASLSTQQTTSRTESTPKQPTSQTPSTSTQKPTSPATTTSDVQSNPNSSANPVGRNLFYGDQGVVSGERFVEGMLCRAIIDRERQLSVIVCDVQDDEYDMAVVSIENSSTEKSVDLNPENFFLSVKKRNQEKIKTMTAESYERIVSRIKKRYKWNSFFNSLSTGLATMAAAQPQTAYISTTGDIRANIYVTTPPDPKEKRMAQLEGGIRQQEINKRKEAGLNFYEKMTFRHHTLDPQSNYTRAIFFKREKDVEAKVFSLFIGDTFYHIPFLTPKRK